MPNQETSVDQYRKSSFMEHLSPNTYQGVSSRKNSGSSVPPPKLLKEEVLYESNAIQLSECTYSDLDGNEKTIPVIHKRHPSRKNTLDRSPSIVESSNSSSAGILSIGILRRHILCDCLILVKKYRPSLKSYVLEFPAKIVETTPAGVPLHALSNSNLSSTSDSESDHSSIVGDMAVQNVEENTGYRSTQIQWVSPETAMEPDLSDHKLKLVSVLIDGDDPIRNNFSCVDNSDESQDSSSSSNPTPSDYETEIEVIPVPVNGLLDRLDEYDRQGVVIDARVYAFAIGLKRGEKLAQSTVGTQPENIEIAL